MVLFRRVTVPESHVVFQPQFTSFLPCSIVAAESSLRRKLAMFCPNVALRFASRDHGSPYLYKATHFEAKGIQNPNILQTLAVTSSIALCIVHGETQTRL